MAAVTQTGQRRSVVSIGVAILNAFIASDTRTQWWNKFKVFAAKNPKVTAFLLTNLILSAMPLISFIIFILTVFIFSMIAVLLMGLVIVLSCTVFILLVGLFMVLPTLALTTMAATCIYVWALGGYYVLKWFNRTKGSEDKAEAHGDKFDNATWLKEAVRNMSNGEDGTAIEKGSLSTLGNSHSTTKATTLIHPPPVSIATAEDSVIT